MLKTSIILSLLNQIQVLPMFKDTLIRRQIVILMQFVLEGQLGELI